MNISSINQIIDFKTVTVPTASDKATANTPPQPKEQPAPSKRTVGIDVTA